MEETAQWRKIVSNRRHLENEASTKRFQTLEKEMEQSKSNLQFSIRDKESRAAKRKRDFERQKVSLVFQKILPKFKKICSLYS